MRKWPTEIARRWELLVAFSVLFALPAFAQGNYEIQVYGAATVEPKTTMFELHSNFTIDGEKEVIDSVYPTNHQEHETLKISCWAWTSCPRLAFMFSPASRMATAGNGSATTFVHGCAYLIHGTGRWGLVCRPRSATSARHILPDTWTWEIRPIIDKSAGRWYFAVNPAFERTLHGPDVNQGFQFAPAVKVSYDFTKVVSGGVEYSATTARSAI